MKFVKSSFIPDRKINLALVDGRITNSMIKNLNDINVNIIKSEKCKETYEAISYHPDINLIKLNDENILVSPNLYDYYNEVLSPLGFNISSGDSIIKNKYPYNVAYNAIIII